jgi:hypothetical protein
VLDPAHPQPTVRCHAIATPFAVAARKSNQALPGRWMIPEYDAHDDTGHERIMECCCAVILA